MDTRDRDPDAERPAWARIDAVFSALLDLPPEQRAAALAEHCGDDHALTSAVRRLLDAERRSVAAFESAAASVQALAEDAVQPFPDDEAIPPALQQVGTYRLTERLGAGGMSVVWKAERSDGEFQQTVAIKLMRRWIESDDTVQRFRAERGILAGPSAASSPGWSIRISQGCSTAASSATAGRTSSWSMWTACRSRSTATIAD